VTADTIQDMTEAPEIDIRWDVLIPPNASAPDLRRTQRIWVSVAGVPAGGAFVSTTGFAEAVLRIDDDRWTQAVTDAVRTTLTKQGELQFSQNPGPQDHFIYQVDGLWTNSPLPDVAIPKKE
jgi:hypothetical protein